MRQVSYDAGIQGFGTVPFIVLTTPRTGSTWLVTLLDSHPEVAAYEELFLPNQGAQTLFGASGVDRFAYAAPASARATRRPVRTFAYLNELFGQSTAPRAVGFKLMYGQLRQHPEIVAYVVRHRVRVLHLVRTNLLDTLISRATMTARGTAHARKREEVRPLRVVLDERKVYRRLLKLEIHVTLNRLWLRALRVPHLELSYEELVDSPEPLARLLRWLGVSYDTSELQSELVRQNVNRQSELVENYDAVARLLAGTRYATFLER